MFWGERERERIEDPFGCVLLKIAPLKPAEALNDKLVPSSLSFFSLKHNHPRLVGVRVFRSSGRKKIAHDLSPCTLCSNTTGV